MCCARFSSLARRYQIVFANVASLLMSGQLYDIAVGALGDGGEGVMVSPRFCCKLTLSI